MEALVVDKLSLSVVGVFFALLAWRSLKVLYYNKIDLRERIDASVGLFLGVFFLVQVFLFWVDGQTSSEAWRFFDLVVGIYMLARVSLIDINRNGAEHKAL